MQFGNSGNLRFRTAAFEYGAPLTERGGTQAVGWSHEAHESLRGSVHQLISAEVGKTAEWSFHVDSNKLLHLTILATGTGASFQVDGPDGKVLEMVGYEAESLGGNARYVVCDIEAPPVGASVVRLTAAAAEAATLSVSVSFSNDLYLHAQVSPSRVSSVGGCTALEACLRDSSGLVVATDGVVITCEVASTDGRAHLVSLKDDGLSNDGAAADGLYGSILCGTAIGGVGEYDLVFRCRGNGKHRNLWRDSVVPLTMSTDGVSFIGAAVLRPIDSDGNHLTDRIEVLFSVKASESTELTVMAHLASAQGSILHSVQQSIVVPTGKEVPLSLIIPSEYLVRDASLGPMWLTNIVLFESRLRHKVSAVAPPIELRGFPIESLDPPPPPRLVSCSPERGPARGGNEVLLRGTHLFDTIGVTIGGIRAPFEIRDDIIVAVFPPCDTTNATTPLSIVLDSRWGTTKLVGAYSYEK